MPSDRFVFPYNDKYRWWYCYSTGNGGIAYEHQIRAFPESFDSSDVISELNCEAGEQPSGYRGFSVIELKEYMDYNIKKEGFDEGYAKGMKDCKNKMLNQMKTKLAALLFSDSDK
jgi:hypothetical protein